MATIISSTQLNLAEAQKREHYDGSAAIIAELEKTCDLLKVAPWYVASNGVFHTYVKAKKLGGGSFVQANNGIPTLSSQTDVEVLQICDFEAISKIDEKILATARFPQKVRDSEDLLNAQGFLQSWTEKLMYGDADNPDAFKGLAQLRPNIEKGRVFDAKGTETGALSSAWLIEFGEHAMNFRYPDASHPGLTNEDRGLTAGVAPNGGTIYTWNRLFSMRAGLQIFDERSVLRMANIATSGTTGLFDVNLAIEMKNALPHRGQGAAWFVNRTVMSQIESQLYEKSNISYSRRDIEGFGPVAYVLGIPVLLWDDILDTETLLTEAV